MHIKFLRPVAFIVLVSFSLLCLSNPSPATAQTDTGTLKIFSEVKGIELFIDEKPQGKDMAEISNVQIGSHYVKAVKDGVIVFSELITVSAGATTILIKDTGQVKEKILEGKYKEQQEYKSKKLDILLSKGMATYGSSYTSSSYYPGYYCLFGSGWTSSSTVQYETTDWKIIKGGVQKISDSEFAMLTNDKDAQAIIKEAWENYHNKIIAGGIAFGVGLGLSLISLFVQGDAQAMVLALGICPTVIGGAMVLGASEPSGHFMTPDYAAKKAYQYNQELKSSLGLPENYEPQQ